MRRTRAGWTIAEEDKEDKVRPTHTFLIESMAHPSPSATAWRLLCPPTIAPQRCNETESCQPGVLNLTKRAQAAKVHAQPIMNFFAVSHTLHYILLCTHPI